MMSTSVGSLIYLMLYIDNVLVSCSSMVQVVTLKELLSSKFHRKDFGLCKDDSWYGDI